MKALFVLFVALTSVVCQEENCGDREGRCIPITECDRLKGLIKGTSQDRELLRQWHCGFVGDVPMVCCPHESSTTEAPSRYACKTLEGTRGKCVGLADCPDIALRFTPPVKPTDVDYVQRSRCIGPDPNKYSVCCGNPTNTTDASNRNANTCQSNGLPDPNSDCCGVDSSSGNRIIHGEPTSIDQYPWLALIEYTRDYLCGGSLISNRFVLTAAHCVVTNTGADLGATSVRLGEYNTTNTGKDCIEVEGGGQDCTNGTITYDIVEKIVHPEYNSIKGIVQANDIALLKLNDTVPFTEFLRPICLPTSDLTFRSNFKFFIAGWGGVDDFRIRSDIKLHTDIPHVDLTVCRPLYSQKGKTIIWDKQICAGGYDNKDSCKGDSGGPLMTINEKKHEITGIISFGVLKCGSIGKPSVYTKVFDYIPWIKSKVNS